jgi:hypothetical protein
MSYDRQHYWLTQRSRPLWRYSMLYGCGCGVVGKSNYLMTSTEMRFFWLLLSTIKFNGSPFTHIFEWKRSSPSSRSSGYVGWIILVSTVALGSASFIDLILLLFESESELGIGSFSLSSSTNDYFERHSSVFFQGLLWKSHHFLMSFFIFPFPFFSCGLD